MKQELAPLLELSLPERLQLIEGLWDSIADEQTALPLADWKLKEVLRRKEDLEKNPSSGMTEEQVDQFVRGGK